MATAPLPTLSMEEYLRRAAGGERLPEYVDGELLERPMPGDKHSEMQGLLIVLLWTFTKTHKAFVRPELHVRVAPSKTRVADVAVFWPERPNEATPTNAPLIVIEVISPDDALNSILARLADYEAMGVKHVWAVDPDLGELFRFERGSLLATPAFEIPEFQATLTAEEILGPSAD